MNIFEIINDWLKQYEPIGSWLYFNSTPVELGATSMNSLSNSSKREYIDGSVDYTILFSVHMVKSYDEAGTSDTNLYELNEINQFTDWIREQNKLKNYPELIENCTVQDIEVLTTIPSIAINKENQLARYSFSAKLIYRDESEVIVNG